MISANLLSQLDDEAIKTTKKNWRKVKNKKLFSWRLKQKQKKKLLNEEKKTFKFASWRAIKKVYEIKRSTQLLEF